MQVFVALHEARRGAGGLGRGGGGCGASFFYVFRNNREEAVWLWFPLDGASFGFLAVIESTSCLRLEG